MKQTTDTFTGKPFRWNGTMRAGHLNVPARCTPQTAKHLHPHRVPAGLLAKLNPQVALLAAAARPINDADWGSERQVNAENTFFDVVRVALPGATFAALESYCHKARTEEMIEEALRLLDRAERWGPACPWPMLPGEDGPIVELN